MIGFTTSVLLPDELWEQHNTLPEDKFTSKVREYLKKYPDYELVEAENGFAICKRKEDWNG